MSELLYLQWVIYQVFTTQILCAIIYTVYRAFIPCTVLLIMDVGFFNLFLYILSSKKSKYNNEIKGLHVGD